MKKTTLLATLFVTLIVLTVTLVFYIKHSPKSIVLGVQKENQFYYFFNENQELIFSESISNIKREDSIRVEWTASYKYPYLNDEPIDISLTEDDLTWEWKRLGSQVTGESYIESSPIILKYYIDNGVVTGEITIENRTSKAIKSLEYILRIKHPPYFKVENNKLIQSKENNKQSLYITSDKYSGELLPDFEGKETSSSKYVLSVGDIKPGELNTAIFHFSYEK